MNIAFVLFPDFEELDFAGPWEVFGMASHYVDTSWKPYTIAEKPTVRAFLGMNITVDHTFESAPVADLIVIPGGFGTRRGMTDEKLLGYIRKAAAGAQYVTSVCTGAMLLKKLGLLEGKRATTHWGAKPEFRELGGDTQLMEERWVHDGNIITAAGVSAGIDMALYVVGLLKGPEEARKVQKFMEYDPAPPYAEVTA